MSYKLKMLRTYGEIVSYTKSGGLDYIGSSNELSFEFKDIKLLYLTTEDDLDDVVNSFGLSKDNNSYPSMWFIGGDGYLYLGVSGESFGYFETHTDYDELSPFKPGENDFNWMMCRKGLVYYFKFDVGCLVCGGEDDGRYYLDGYSEYEWDFIKEWYMVWNRDNRINIILDK